MRHAFLTLDYELFFGSRSGTVERCLLQPTEAVAALIEKFGGRLVLFVDVGFIVALKAHVKKFPHLNAQLHNVQQQLEQLVKKGHDVQLHIHPHWMDSHYDGENWHIDTKRYRLHDFTRSQVSEIVREYKLALTDIVGDRVFAYRAGGWCIQPFEHLKDALKESEIWLDSTVYQNGLSEDSQRGFDFRGMPEKQWWRFEDDPLVEADNGYFVELPISSYKASPLLFWKMAFAQKLVKNLLHPFGDGQSIRADRSYYISRLTRSSTSVLSIDGIKADFTYKAIRSGRYRSKLLNIMGHPKSLSQYSLSKFEQLLESTRGDYEFSSFQELKAICS